MTPNDPRVPVCHGHPFWRAVAVASRLLLGRYGVPQYLTLTEG